MTSVRTKSFFTAAAVVGGGGGGGVPSLDNTVVIECITVCCFAPIVGYEITFSFTTPPNVFYQMAVIVSLLPTDAAFSDIYDSKTWNGKLVLPPAASFEWANKTGSDQVDISVSGYELYP